MSSRSVTVKSGESIQDAIDQAGPGDTITLSDGNYAQDFETVADGEMDSPITIKGTRKAVVTGESNSRIVQVFVQRLHLIGDLVLCQRQAPSHF